MLKGKSKGILRFIIATFTIVLIVFIVKYRLHKKEIEELLEVQDTIEISEEENTINIDEDNQSIDVEGKKQEKNNSTRIVRETSYDAKKIKSTSENVHKKTKKGMDFITTKKDMNNTSNIYASNNGLEYNNSDYELLAKLIYSEAGNEPYQGKVAVGNVVLYRSQQNNQSIRDVIFAKGQFDGVHTENFNREPSEESKIAAKEVLSGTKIIENGYFFANLNMCSPSWARKETFIKRIGDHWFFRRE